MQFLEDWILDETTGLRGIFNKYRVGGVPDQPIEITSVLYDFDKSVTPNANQLPAVSFAMGAIEPNGGLAVNVNAVRENFLVLVHTVINLGTSTSMITRIANMTELMGLVVKELEMSGQLSDPNLAQLHGVRLRGMVNTTPGVSNQNEVDYLIEFDYSRI